MIKQPMAFPFSYPSVGNSIEHNQGMTLRDYFAGQALANSAICSNDEAYPQKVAYAYADAMLKERSK